jgi:hypothetical protein
MEQTSFDTGSSNDPNWSLKRLQSSKPMVRRRSACNVCHEGKIKCSGGLTCVACQLSGLQCTYSLISRLGRPKGSKNKRTLQQQNEHDSGKKSHRRNDSHALEPQGHQGPQQANAKGSSDLFTWSADLDQVFDTTFAGNYAGDALDDLLYPGLVSSIDKFDPESVTQAQSATTEYGLDSFFAKVCKYPIAVLSWLFCA